MNRAHRRALARRQRKIAAVAAVVDAAKQRARADGRPCKIIGFTTACADCTATADVTMHPDGRATSDVWHSPNCPAANGAVPWRVVA